MSIGSSWQSTSASERVGNNRSTLAPEVVHGGDFGRLQAGRAELSEALSELSVADGHAVQADARYRQALDWVGDAGRAHWNACLTSSVR